MSIRKVQSQYAGQTFTAQGDGRIFNAEGTELSQQRDGEKRRVTLKTAEASMKVAVHRIMGICFLGATNFVEVGHIDGNGSDNDVKNLTITKTYNHEVTKAGNSISIIESTVENLADLTEEVTISNGYGTFTVLRADFENSAYYRKHNFQIVGKKAA